MRKECSVKEGRAITCHRCGFAGGTMSKDSMGYVHYPNCPPHRKPVLTIPTPQELYAMWQPIQNR